MATFKYAPGCNCCEGCIIFQDKFERADDTDLGSEWTEASGDWSISSGKLVTTDTDAACIYAGLDVDLHNVIKVKLQGNSGDKIRVIVNYIDVSNYLFVEIEYDTLQATVRSYEKVAGVDYQLGQDVIAYEIRAGEEHNFYVGYIRQGLFAAIFDPADDNYYLCWRADIDADATLHADTAFNFWEGSYWLNLVDYRPTGDRWGIGTGDTAANISIGEFTAIDYIFWIPQGPTEHCLPFLWCQSYKDIFDRPLTTVWDEQLGTWSVSAGNLIPSSGASRIINNIMHIDSNMEVGLVVDWGSISIGNTFSVLLDWLDANNHYRVEFEKGNPPTTDHTVRIYEMIGGVETQLGGNRAAPDLTNTSNVINLMRRQGAIVVTAPTGSGYTFETPYIKPDVNGYKFGLAANVSGLLKFSEVFTHHIYRDCRLGPADTSAWALGGECLACSYGVKVEEYSVSITGSGGWDGTYIFTVDPNDDTHCLYSNGANKMQFSPNVIGPGKPTTVRIEIQSPFPGAAFGDYLSFDCELLSAESVPALFPSVGTAEITAL